MMEQVGIFDAKVHLSKLVERVNRGETVLITRNGRPMAKLSPAGQQASTQLSADEAIQVLRGIRSRNARGADVTIRDLIDEGRRF